MGEDMLEEYSETSDSDNEYTDESGSEDSETSSEEDEFLELPMNNMSIRK